jgi:hypothetical protein
MRVSSDMYKADVYPYPFRVSLNFVNPFVADGLFCMFVSPCYADLKPVGSVMGYRTGYYRAYCADRLF